MRHSAAIDGPRTVGIVVTIMTTLVITLIINQSDRRTVVISAACGRAASAMNIQATSWFLPNRRPGLARFPGFSSRSLWTYEHPYFDGTWLAGALTERACIRLPGSTGGKRATVPGRDIVPLRSPFPFSFLPAFHGVSISVLLFAPPRRRGGCALWRS